MVLFAILLNRLKIFRLGIFSLGFINLFTAFFPHFILTPILAIKNGAQTYALLKARDIQVDDAIFIQALLLLTVMLTCLIIGTLLPKTDKTPFFTRFKSEVLFKYPFLVFCCFLFFMGFSIFIRGYFIGTYNPFILLSFGRTDEFNQYYKAYNLSYPLTFAKAGLLFTQAILTIYYLLRYPNKKGFAYALGICLICLLALMVSGSRQTLLSAPIITGFLIHFYLRKIPNWIVFSALPIVLFVIPVYKSLAHGKTLDYLMKTGQLYNLDNIANGLTQRFGNFQVMVRFLEWFDLSNIALGSRVISIFVRPIPRALIPWKPPSNDIFFTKTIYGQDAAIQIHGGWGEMLHNFWLPGLIVWFIILGYLLSRFHFGFYELVKNKNHLAIAMIISNFAFLRALPNFGINTISTQSMLFTIGTQVFLLWSFKAYHYLTRKP